MLDLKPATFEELKGEAERGTAVPVVRSVLADLQTPVGAFLRIAGDAPYAFLLESIEGGERVARYSFLGANPWMIARGRGAETIIEKNGEREVRNQSAVDFLREYFRDKRLARRAGLAPLSGGAVGYLVAGPVNALFGVECHAVLQMAEIDLAIIVSEWLRGFYCDAPSLAAAVTSAWAAVHAEHSSPPRRRPFSLFQRAQRTGGQDASGWVLDRIARTDRPASPPEA